jgi:hypothetical protein
MPQSMQIFISGDGKNFTLLTELANSYPTDQYESKGTQNLEAVVADVKTRYVKIVGISMGKVPAWHPGAGGQSWIFCDEIWVQ